MTRLHYIAKETLQMPLKEEIILDHVEERGQLGRLQYIIKKKTTREGKRLRGDARTKKH